MPSVLTRITDAIFEQLQEVRQEFGRSALDRAHWIVGRNALVQHKSVPYVAWIPVDGKVDKPSSTNPIRDGNVSVSARYEASTNVECMLCAATYDEAEELHFDLLEAEFRALGSHKGVGTFRWLTQEPDKAGLTLAGELVVQQFTWPFIVPREIKTLVVPTSSDHECSLIP